MNVEFRVETFLLAVASMRAGELVHLLAGQVLEKYGVNWCDILGAVSDNGSAVKFAFSNIDGVRFESYITNLLNRAIIDADGLSIAPASSKHPAAGGVLHNMNKMWSTSTNPTRRK